MYFIKAQENLNEWWRYLITLTITFFSYIVIGALPLILVITIQSLNGVPIDLNTFVETSNPEAIGIGLNFGLILLLFPSVLAFFVLWILIKKFHQTGSGKIASASGRIRWSKIFQGALLWIVLLIIAELIFHHISPENYAFQFDPAKFLPLLVIALVFIPFQSWFEELLFRGYLMQGLGIVFRLRFIALILTSLGFGLLHSFNPEVKEFGLLSTMPYYIGFGLFTGLLVILDDGIELACGIHAINNIYSAVFVTYESSVLKTPAIWSIQKLNPWTMNIAFLAMAVIFILIMTRYYNWTDWKKIIRPIPKLSD